MSNRPIKKLRTKTQLMSITKCDFTPAFVALGLGLSVLLAVPVVPPDEVDVSDSSFLPKTPPWTAEGTVTSFAFEAAFLNESRVFAPLSGT
jgi:hypothetical protein